MKEPLDKKADGRVCRHKGWYQHLANCIAAEQCPNCGEHIVVHEEMNERNYRKTFFFRCSACPWRTT